MFSFQFPQNTKLVETVEELKQQLGGKATSGDEQKVGTPGSISPSHTHPRAAAPSPGLRHQVPFGEDDEQVIPVLSLERVLAIFSRSLYCSFFSHPVSVGSLGSSLVTVAFDVHYVFMWCTVYSYGVSPSLSLSPT